MNTVEVRVAKASLSVHRLKQIGRSLALGVILSCSLAVSAPATDEGRPQRPVAYSNEKIAEGPWSVHLIKIDRTNSEYALHTMLATDVITGMTTLTDQVKAFPTNLGRPVVAINGDFYNDRPKAYSGDPRGIQIVDGEIVSAPDEHPCFWIDAGGKPRTEIVQSIFRATWPDGTTTPFRLNEERTEDTAVLYTPRMGPFTGTKGGGREVILEPVDEKQWLPLRVGVKIKARVREILETGDTALRPGLMVFSFGPNLLVDAPFLKNGDVVQVSTATVPTLAGCNTAIGGGPRLVMDGKPVNGWQSPTVRHPRTAVGWNDTHLYLALVDGRQPGLSVGMGFQELADYFIKIGCTHAINLDGGGSASMWAFGQVVSSPSEGQERPIANGLVLVKKPRKEEDKQP